ncbi:hypothetical protein C0993_003080, partial [Termitomyces sp. T159_Od127]
QSKGGVLTYADSGATDHCFVQQSDFEEYQTYITPCQGMSANRRGVFGILGTGMVRKTVKVDGKVVHLVFKSALHTPDLSANLISIRKFDDLGFSVLFKGGQAIFSDPSGYPFMVGNKRDRMYLLELHHGIPQAGPGLPLTSPSTTSLKVLVVRGLPFNFHSRAHPTPPPGLAPGPPGLAPGPPGLALDLRDSF